jgi:hypothetical protein
MDNTCVITVTGPKEMALKLENCTLL